MAERIEPSPQVLWQAENLEGELLNGPWQLLLLGDGSPTRHLQLLTGAVVEVEVAAEVVQVHIHVVVVVVVMCTLIQSV